MNLALLEKAEYYLGLAVDELLIKTSNEGIAIYKKEQRIGYYKEMFKVTADEKLMNKLEDARWKLQQRIWKIKGL